MTSFWVVRLRGMMSRVVGRIGSTVYRVASAGRVRAHPDTRWHGMPYMWASRGASISIAPDSVFVSQSRWNPVTPARRCSIRAFAPGATVEIGQRFRCTGLTIASRCGVSLGDDVMIGSDVLIIDSDFHAVDPALRLRGGCAKSAPVRIGDNVFIGARSIILKGISIGNGATVGAGSVVVRDVPAGAVVAGNPARVIRQGGVGK